MGPGQRPFGIDQPPRHQMQMLTIQGEMVRPANRRHGVGHQKHPVRQRAGADGQRQHGIGDMVAIADEPGKGRGVDRRSGNPRAAVQHRRHGVEQVGECARALGQR